MLQERRSRVKVNIHSEDDVLSEKEMLFCRYFIKDFDFKQAAVNAGYKNTPEKAGIKLIKKSKIQKEIKRLREEKIKDSRDNIQSGYERLAYGRVSDCIKLLFSQSADSDDFDNMDFFNIAEVKKLKDGAMEIKFFDRFKALDRLNELDERELSETPSIYKALQKSANALKTTDDKI
ncbi:MAG: terminase small subunit [Clostridia bacterium]|nr:terminase small subunit [Clostridia bacterium]